jgi:hypothetical protein
MSMEEWDLLFIFGGLGWIEGLLNNDVHVCALHMQLEMEMEMAGEGGIFGIGGLL